MNRQLDKIFERILPSFRLQEGSVSGALKQVRLFGKSYSITKWDDGKYREALRQVANLYPKSDLHYVESWFSGALGKILMAGATAGSIKDVSEDLHNDLLRGITTRSVCIPLQGVDFRLDVVDFGIGKLFSSAKGTLPNIINNPNSLNLRQHDLNVLPECRCYFQLEVEADHKTSISRAMFFSTYLAALLSLYVGSSQYRMDHEFRPWHERSDALEVGRKRKISPYGSETGMSQVYYEFYPNSDQSHKAGEYLLNFGLLASGHDSNQAIGEFFAVLDPEQEVPTYHLVDGAVVQAMLSAENERLLKCTSLKSPIDKKLFNAVRWFGKGVNSDNSEDQFLFFAIAIESLLIEDEPSELSSHGSITQRVAERSAFLIGKTFEERIQIEHATRQLYRIRSKIAHAGGGATPNMVIEIETLAKKLIFAHSRMKFESESAFVKWIRQCQYGGEPHHA